ncbi:hypothetical protein L3V86_05550 [Thiotrichales bacterium 19S11-10]|nr:hypothetical protein [Thiotrichales bacterium 19S11-10]MCF6807870.1 hypothetical protein [Thiotrichales bacterium 19S9-11]MCF6811884.1 hypothetical protein [Thiotrichales bacterium 19S9-12]
MEQETELQFESLEQEGMLILKNANVEITNQLQSMLENSASPVQLALSIRQLHEAGKLSKIDNLEDYQRWLEVDGSLFLELVELDKHQILANLQVELIGDNVRDYAIFSSISTIIKNDLESEIKKYYEAINHPRFDYVNFNNKLKVLSRR